MSDLPAVRPDVLNIIAFDLDGTLAEGTWPFAHIGAPIQDGIDALRHYSDEGFAIIIHTARPASHHKAIVAWLQAQDIDHLVYDVVCGKPLACLYVDDKAFRPPWIAGPLPVGPAQPLRARRDEDPEPEPEPDQEPFDPNDWTVMG